MKFENTNFDSPEDKFSRNISQKGKFCRNFGSKKLFGKTFLVNIYYFVTVRIWNKIQKTLKFKIVSQAHQFLFTVYFILTLEWISPQTLEADKLSKLHFTHQIISYFWMKYILNCDRLLLDLYYNFNSSY